mmetsp:Transcript_2099/g.6171  ORF Transcript_2099/g.6171 Transcript_2099/m.6171 type:complete len:304 (-) Transcript_2099:128-1039(-)
MSSCSASRCRSCCRNSCWIRASALRSLSSTARRSCASSPARRWRSAWKSAKSRRRAWRRAAVSTPSFDGISPRNCWMPRSTFEQRSARLSMQRPRPLKRSTIEACMEKTMWSKHRPTDSDTINAASSRAFASSPIRSSNRDSASTISCMRCSSSSRRRRVSSSTLRSKSWKVEPKPKSLLRRCSWSPVLFPVPEPTQAKSSSGEAEAATVADATALILLERAKGPKSKAETTSRAVHLSAGRGFASEMPVGLDSDRGEYAEDDGTGCGNPCQDGSAGGGELGLLNSDEAVTDAAGTPDTEHRA